MAFDVVFCLLADILPSPLIASVILDGSFSVHEKGHL